MTVQALRGGSPEVLADLLDRYGRDMQAVAYLILRDRAAAEDVVADSLIAALEHGHRLRDDDSLRPWLLRIATNKALRTRERSARVVELDVVADVASSIAGPGADEALALWHAVQALPPRMRAADRRSRARRRVVLGLGIAAVLVLPVGWLAAGGPRPEPQEPALVVATPTTTVPSPTTPVPSSTDAPPEPTTSPSAAPSGPDE